MSSPNPINGQETPEVVTDQEARQGPKGRPVLMVLLASLALAAVYLVTTLVWTGTQSPDATGSTTPPASQTLPQNPNPPPPGASGTVPKQ